MLVRWNRYGRFLGCSGYPECRGTRSLDGFDPGGRELGVHPEEGRPVRLKLGPYGPYVELEAATESEKPKRASLPKGKEPADVDLEFALKMLELPRTVGTDPDSGEEVVAGIGRFGPFVRRGKTFASLTAEGALWTVDLEEAVRLINAKAAGKRAPLKELGRHPRSGAELVVLSGRYGPYVTDGKVNATLPKDLDPEDVDLETAVGLIAEKAARGGGKGGARGRRGGGGGSGGAPKKGSSGARKRGSSAKRGSAQKRGSSAKGGSAGKRGSAGKSSSAGKGGAAEEKGRARTEE
jgi:DNA topoisomerase-1